MVRLPGFTHVKFLMVIASLFVFAKLFFLIIKPDRILAETRNSTRIKELSSVNKAIATSLDSSFISAGSYGIEDSCTNTITAVDGSGWVGGWNMGSLDQSIPRLPLDPENSGIYCYKFKMLPSGVWELNAKLDISDPNAASLMINDGGNDPGMYELGSDLNII